MSLLILGLALVFGFALSRAGSDATPGNPSAPLSLAIDPSTTSVSLKSGLTYVVQTQFDASGEGWTFFPTDVTVVHYVAMTPPPNPTMTIQAGRAGSTVAMLYGQGTPNGAVNVNVNA